MQATIQVKYVNPPKPGGKMANVKDAEGNVYFFYPDKFSAQPGETVEYEQQNWKGKPALVIKGSLMPVAPDITKRPPAAPAPAYVPPAHFREPPAANGHATGKDKLIFVTGVVGRAMGSGKYDPNDIGLLTKAAVVAFHESFGDGTP
jgi:hypothetical protein